MSRFHDLLKNDPEWLELRLEVLERDGHQCLECGADHDLTVEHIIPLSLCFELGKEITNLITLCRPCNSRKGDRVGELQRVTWINPRYSMLDAVLNRHGQDPGGLPFSQNQDENISL